MDSGQVRMKFDCTGVILAGGKNSRFPGKKKAFRKVGDEMILTSVCKVFSRLFKEVILVVNDPGEFCGWDATLVTDIYPDRCALAGLHAGLVYASSPYIFVSPCDTPFVDSRIIEYIIDQIEPGYDVIIPRTDGGFEPLSAVYSKECIPLIETNLDQKIFMIKKFFRRKKVKEISAIKLKELDQDMQFVFNVNTPEDLDTAEKLYRK